MKTKEMVIGVFLAVLMLLTGCQFGFNEPAQEGNSGDGEVLVSISAGHSDDVVVNRTVLPQVGQSDITSYELWGDAGTGSKKLASFDPVAITDASVSLVPGTWDFSLKAFKLGDLILQGDLEDKVISTSANSLSFVLSPINSGTGSIRMTVNFPDNAGIVSAVALVGETTETLVISGTSVTYSDTIASAGNLFISIQLKDSAGTLVGIVSELVLVRSNLNSEKDFTLSPDDLRFTVIIPVGIAAVPGDNGAVQINWNPVAGAVSYGVYRAVEPETEYSYIGESAVPAFTDTTAEAGSTCAYKVSAINSNGVESQLSATSSSVTPLLGFSSFAFHNAAEGTVISTTADAITVSVPTIVDLSVLTPVIVHNGAFVSPASGVPHDFSSPVAYTVTAAGGATKTYTVTVTPADTTLAGALSWIDSNAKDEGEYSIVMNGNETLSPQTLSYSMKRVGISLKGRTAERTVTLGSNGSLFTIGAQVTLKLDDKITLMGKTDNTASLLTMLAGSKLIMESGSKISGNSASNTSGAGIYINANSSVTMNGGEISGNTVVYSTGYYSSSYGGGGIYVAGDGVFTMTDGTISGNIVSRPSSSYNYSSRGGGIYVAGDGVFTMTNGTISGNTASSYSSSSPYSCGGGVYISGRTVTMTNTEISGNMASSTGISDGGGIYIDGGHLTMTGGIIKDNTAGSARDSSISNASSVGGGVYVSTGEFSMTNGEISNNTAIATNSGTSSLVRFYGGGIYANSGTVSISNSTLTGNKANASVSSFSNTNIGGGAVYVADGSVTVSGGEISANQSSYNGGGVYIAGGSFTMNDSEMKNNTIPAAGYGGGVMQTGGTFTMNDGTITGHTANRGGAVYQSDGTFTLVDGIIDSNNASDSGAGIYSISTTTTTLLNLNGGEIKSNIAENYGGGVYFSGSGTGSSLTLDGAKILDNSTSSLSGSGGGGIYFSYGAFAFKSGEISSNGTAQNGGGIYMAGDSSLTMTGGTINNNIAAQNGGGVYVWNGTFKKQPVLGGATSGIISGSDAAEGVKNSANEGQAVYISSSMKRNTTAGESDALDSTVDGAGGGWE